MEKENSVISPLTPPFNWIMEEGHSEISSRNPTLHLDNGGGK
jgi:hypothetical protein